MSSLMLYSTNPYIKSFIQHKFRGDVHYVWCSESLNPALEHPDSANARVPPSSSPAAIFADLKEAVRTDDRGNLRIKGQRLMLAGLARKWEKNSEITADQKQEILFHVRKGPLHLWRPKLYVIPRGGVEARLKPVPARRRAGTGMEYIIEDLRRDEFDMTEI